MAQVTSGFGPDDDKTAVEILKKWNGGPLGDELFTVIAGMIPQSIVEVVVLRQVDGVVQALLIPRPAGDVLWSGMEHTPGTVLRNSDFLREDNNPLQGAFDRVRREISTPFVSGPAFVGMHYNMGQRGAGVSQIFVATITESERSGNSRWYPVLQLPGLSTFIQEQYPFVKMAADFFMSEKGKEGNL